MKKRPPKPVQLALDLQMPAVITPASDLARAIFKAGALPSCPLHVPGSAEEAAAIAAIPFGQRWGNYVAAGAFPERIEISLSRKNRVTLHLTETRLGWTSGYHLWMRDAGGGGGGYLHPDFDEHGHFLWTSREEALRSAAHQAWWAAWKTDAKLAAEIERALEKALGASPVQSPGHDAKRWLVSRVDGLASLERRRADPGGDVPESPAMDEYRRACGLTDTTVWRAAA